MNIKEIEKLLKNVPQEHIEEALRPFQTDEREGVKKLIQRYQKKADHYKDACQQWQLRMTFDEVISENKIVAGVDEVGRGPLAGPVVAAAVILPENARIIGLRDSKKLSETKREALYDEIKETALAIGVGIVEASRIDEINILQATFEAMRKALSGLQIKYDMILVDGDKKIPKVMHKQECIISGDDKSACIGAASVIAKVTRDRMMVQYAKQYPGYDWESNKGYGSARHYEAIHSQGITPLHRKSFLKNEGIE